MDETYSYYEPPADMPGGTGMILRTSDQAHIPLDLANMDYQRFLAWVDEGNDPPEGWSGPTNE